MNYEFFLTLSVKGCIMYLIVRYKSRLYIFKQAN